MNSILSNTFLSLSEKISLLSTQHSFFLEGHSEIVNQIALSHDNTILATGSLDKSARLWGMESKSQLAQFSHIQGGIYSLLISLNNKYLICGTGQKQVIVFNIKSRSEEVVFEGLNRIVWKLAATSDTKYVVAASIENVITVWNYFKKVEASKLVGHKTGVTDLSVFQDKFLLSGGFDKFLIVWDLLYMEIKFKIPAHNGYINELKVVEQNGLVLTCSQDCSIKLWSVLEGSFIAELKGHIEAVTCINLNSTLDILVSGSADKTVKIWSLLSLSLTINLTGLNKPANFVGFTKNNKFIVAGCSDSIKCWELQTKNAFASFEQTRIEFRKGVVSENFVVAATSDFGIRVWDVERKEEKRFDGHLDCVSCIKGFEGFLITGGNDGSIRVWKVSEKRQVACFMGHKRFVNKVSWSKSLKFFVSGSGDRYFCVWKNQFFGA